MFATGNWALRHGFQNPNDMLLKTDTELTPGALASGYLAADDVVYRTGVPLLGTVEVCIDEVGLPDWYVTHKFPLRGHDGGILGVLGISRACHGAAPEDSPNARIAPATRLLRHDLMEFPHPKRLAKICGLSVRHLQRCFEETFGISPRTYWMKCRIRAACEKLRTGTEPIAVVAQGLGFCDQSGFTAHFKTHTGQTPKGFRLGATTKRA